MAGSCLIEECIELIDETLGWAVEADMDCDDYGFERESTDDISIYKLTYERNLRLLWALQV